jgi:hypothetical protein
LRRIRQQGERDAAVEQHDRGHAGQAGGRAFPCIAARDPQGASMLYPFARSAAR